MIAVAPGIRILLAVRLADFRKDMDGLASLVQQALRADAFAGEVFIFRPMRADRINILVYTGPACACARKGWTPGGSAGRS